VAAAVTGVGLSILALEANGGDDRPVSRPSPVRQADVRGDWDGLNLAPYPGAYPGRGTPKPVQFGPDDPNLSRPWLWSPTVPGLYGRLSGWPAVRVLRRDLPYPNERVAPRVAGLEVYAPPGSRALLDGEEMEQVGDVFQFSPKDPLLPTITSFHEVRVETPQENGGVLIRRVAVYLRMGRLTQLLFQ
jgi:hypothetical protein